MTTYHYEIGLGFTPTGTATVTSGSPAVSGSATAFLTQMAPGYLIQVAGAWRVVQSVASDTLLTVAVAWAASGSGAMLGANLKNVASLSTPLQAPKSVPAPWASTVVLGSGLQRGLGRPITAWNWGFLTQAQRDVIRAYCPGKSANVYIRSRGLESADAYLYYQAVMLWPDAEIREALAFRVPLEIQFKFLNPLTVS